MSTASMRPITSPSCQDRHKRRLTACRILLCCLVCSALGPSAQRAVRDPIELLIEYRDLVEQYRRKGISGIGDQLDGWDTRRLNEAIALLRAVRASSPFLLDNATGRPEIGGWNMPLVGAAALLHADIYLTDAKKLVRRPEHLLFSARLLGIYSGVEADRERKRRLTLLNAWLRQIAGDFNGVRVLLIDAKQEFPDDAGIVFVEACLEEAAASPRAAPDARASQALVRAEVLYRHALELDVSFAEARVRLGYVLLRLGRFEEARQQLQRASAEGREQRTIYLAHIFAGAVDEAEGRVDEAIAAYRAARTIAPQCQVAAIALSHALYRAGDRASAATIAHEVGRASTRCEDPWWSYDYGQAWKIDETMEMLRRAVQP